MKYIIFKNFGMVLFESPITFQEMMTIIGDKVISSGDIVASKCLSHDRKTDKEDTIKYLSFIGKGPKWTP